MITKEARKPRARVPLKIAILLPDLRGGGAELVNLMLAREFAERGHNVSLALLQRRGELLPRVPARVRVENLQAAGPFKSLLSISNFLSTERPDALVASMWPLTAVALLGSRLTGYRGQVMLVEHSALSQTPQGRGIRGTFLRASLRWIHSQADHVVGVSRGVLSDLRRLGLPPNVGHFIHNPSVLGSSSGNWAPDCVAARSWLSTDKKYRLLSVGALKPAKDHETAFRAVKLLRNAGEPVSMLLVGDGPLREDLEILRDALDLKEHIHFAGFIENPTRFYREAGVFVLSSAWEGFGNVIVEALHAGLPIVATDCIAGPREILDNGRFGKLVPVGDPRRMCLAIRASIAGRNRLPGLVSRAREFSVRRAADAYLALILSSPAFFRKEE